MTTEREERCAVWRDDWPLPGAEIDPAVDDLPHPDCGAEWWYFYAHLTTEHGEQRGLVLAFLRHLSRQEKGEPVHAHATLAALSGGGAHRVRTWVDRGLLESLRIVTERDTVIDPGFRQALSEVFASGQPLAPDRLLTGPVTIAPDELDLRFGDVSALRKLPDGSYHMTFTASDGEDESIDLVLSPTKPPISQVGDRPIPSRFSDRAGGYSYFAPSMTASGVIGSVRVSGTGWYEHTFGEEWLRLDSDQQQAPDRTWTWLGVQLDNGWEVSAATVAHEDVSTGEQVLVDRVGIAYSPENERVECEMEIRGDEPWTSLSTLHTYPSRWTLSAPELGLDLLVVPEPRQEMRTMITGGAILEAWATVEGTMAGAPVRGRAYCEVLPGNRIARMEGFLGRLREITLAEVRALYPDAPGQAVTAGLAGVDPVGLPHEIVHESLVRPLRHMTDATGRGWRAFVACAAIEMFDVRCDPYLPLLAVVELTHTGNLVVDDVEDGSTTRRGVPAVHTLHGVPTAINAGTAAYFVLDRVVPQILPDDDRLRLRVYQSYLRALRAGHVGQAIDITGHRTAMDLAVATGDATAVLATVRNAHRLKTGMPARAFGEIGALIAQADDAQVEAIGSYFEAVGLAYQITDDVLDLAGAARPVPTGKHRGEDLRAGKVTMPLLHAVALLPRERMAEIWAAVRDGDADEAVVRDVARELVACGALQACYDDAQTQVDEAWGKLDVLLPSSFMKVAVRALGVYAGLREAE
ncbi:polyprenyl synthetase family protein [Lentzea sp. NEAU-D7]|uniref:polyprenyl synthetase family protein n=1 Tax=Lentzea sp. NEAU-D7 TaxID=2994667 RepID=UPI00224B9322|nr:polyprenyl synthetase family protein [Lentzea sp. NEAU-D7]MCX2951575.1 polyprenyl synthetase family protein [Lentzea sp. NEAU-D7]